MGGVKITDQKHDRTLACCSIQVIQCRLQTRPPAHRLAIQQFADQAEHMPFTFSGGNRFLNLIREEGKTDLVIGHSTSSHGSFSWPSLCCEFEWSKFKWTISRCNFAIFWGSSHTSLCDTGGRTKHKSSPYAICASSIHCSCVGTPSSQKG